MSEVVGRRPRRHDAGQRPDRRGHRRPPPRTASSTWSAASRTSRTSSSPSTASIRSEQPAVAMATDARALARPARGRGSWASARSTARRVRDSRRAALIVGGVAALFMLGDRRAVRATPEFATIELRQAFIARPDRAAAGAPRACSASRSTSSTLGGFLSWRVGNILPVDARAVVGDRAVRDAGRGGGQGQPRPAGRRRRSRAARSRSRSWAGTSRPSSSRWRSCAPPIFGRRARRSPDCRATRSRSRPPSARRLSTACMMLAAGGVAFATAPFVGRTRALAFGLIALFASYLIYGYSHAVAAHRGAQAAVVLRLDGRPPPDGRRHRLAVGRGAGRSWTWCSSPIGVVGVHPARPRAPARTSAGSDCRRSRPGSPGRSRRQLADRIGDRARVGHRGRAVRRARSSPRPTPSRR